MLNYIVDTYLRDNNISQPKFKPGFIPFKKFSETYKIGSGAIIITELVLIGKVEAIEKLNEGLLIVKSNLNFIDYSEIYRVNEINGLIEIYSDIISIHQNFLEFDLANIELFSNISTGHLKFLKVE